MTVSKEPTFTVGIEEEYLLIDRESRNLITDCPPEMFGECEKLLQNQVTPEFLQSQIEVGSRVAHTLPEAREDLAHLRTTVAQVAGHYDMAIIAASTHPFALWDTQRRTPKERYATLERDLQGVVRRLMISGMHVHVGIEDEDLRIDLLNQAAYILPHLLALSTSSPFWRGEDTGLKSYRIAVWNELPRTGLPEQFDSFGEYQRFVDVMVNAGLIEDSTKIWWDIRPSHRFPTLEMRIADLCTCLDDVICIAALYRCWLRMLYRLKVNNQRWRTYSRYLVNENRWRAQRYGVDRGLVDFGRGEIVPFADLLDEMLSLIAEDAAYFECQAQVEHARTIVARGTSAHWQLRTYQEALQNGAGHDDALKQVVDMLAEETVRDL
ncbi:MAG: carboxylate-amine ligase [Gammaproteobacteria bacterium]|nr:carboxylate-amine ligase [Gammaproteobacteria bacterium]